MANCKTPDTWQQAMLLVKEVYQLMKKCPKDEFYGLISQSEKAAVSIAANIAGGIGRNYRKETIQFLHIPRGAAYENETLPEAVVMVEILSKEEVSTIDMLIEKCIQLINGLIHYYENSVLK
jgi:four helix bundle protein